MRIAKPNDIFVSIEVSFACVNSLYTGKSASTQSQKFGYSVFASEPTMRLEYVIQPRIKPN